MASKKTIIIMHRIPYDKIKYHELIDHNFFNVLYITENGGDIPNHINHTVFHIQSINSIEEIVCYLKRNNFDILDIIALSEYNLISTEIIKSAMGLESENSQSIYNSRDKYMMKKCIINTGIKTAYSQVISDLDELTAKEFTNRKVILKPLNGASSQNTHIININSFSNDLKAEYPNFSQGRFYLAEQFIEGDIYHFDGLVINGTVIFSVPSKYIGTCLDFTKGYPLASIQLDELDFYQDWVSNCVQAVGIKNGAFHLEGILCQGIMYFLEIANRSGGAGVVDCTKNLLDINLMQEEVKIKLHADSYSISNLIPKKERYSWLIINRIIREKKDELLIFLNNNKNIIKYELNLFTDNEFSYNSNYNECVILLESKSYEDLEFEVNKIISLFSRYRNEYEIGDSHNKRRANPL